MSSFDDRQKNLFNHLKDAEDQYSFSKTNKATNVQDYGTIDKQTYRRIKKEMKQFRGKESIFKKSDANIRECLRAKRIPDHVKNPQRWVYYSLADVTSDQMSESTNTATALALMQKLEERQTPNPVMKCDTDDSTVFKKPTFHVSSIIKKKPTENQKITFKSTKVIMPEYVVGVSRKKEKKSSLMNCEQNDVNQKKLNLKLNHLYELDENEEI